MFDMISENVAVDVCCPCCRKISVVEVPADGFIDWLDGALVQDAFPNLSADEREQLISGFCPTCWDKTFSSGY